MANVLCYPEGCERGDLVQRFRIPLPIPSPVFRTLYGPEITLLTTRQFQARVRRHDTSMEQLIAAECQI